MTGDKKPLSAIFFLILLSIITQGILPVSGAVYSINGSSIDAGMLYEVIGADPSLLSGDLPPGTVVFFWNTHCGGCHAAWEFLHEFLPLHREVELRDYNVYSSPVNRTVFDRYKERYNRSHLYVPSMMVGNLTLEGTQDITDHLGRLLELQQEKQKPKDIYSELLVLIQNLMSFDHSGR